VAHRTWVRVVRYSWVTGLRGSRAYGSGPWGRSTPTDPVERRPLTDRSKRPSRGAHLMQRLKAQSWRISVVLSMLVSAALVLEAGARWRQ